MEVIAVSSFEIINLSEAEDKLSEIKQMFLKENVTFEECPEVTMNDVMNELNGDFVALEYGETLWLDVRVPRLGFFASLDFKKIEEQDSDVLKVRFTYNEK